jgi:hypothetical protein
MKLKMLFVALMLTSNAFAVGTAVTTSTGKSAAKPGAVGADTNRAATGDKAAKERIQNGMKQAQDVQARASQVEGEASAKLNDANSNYAVWSQKVAKKIEEKCDSPICSALGPKGQVAELASKGDQNAIYALNTARQVLKGGGDSKAVTERVTEEFAKKGINANDIAENCK